MEDHKFKVGNKVILTGNSWGSLQNSVGDVGFITEANNLCSKVSKTNNLSEFGNWHPNKDFKLYTEEKYFTLDEIKLNNGDVVEHSIGIKYTKCDKGLKSNGSDIYLSKEYYKNGPSSHNKSFKVISRAKTESKEEKTMTSKFVETVTVVNSFVKESIDSRAEGGALISIKPNSTGSRIELVIGADYIKRGAPFFTKVCLATLIEELKAVHSAMV
jgi:hypothetical protein